MTIRIAYEITGNESHINILEHKFGEKLNNFARWISYLCIQGTKNDYHLSYMCSRPLNLTRNSGSNCGLYWNVSALTSYMSKTTGNFRPLSHKMLIDHILLGNTSPLKHTHTTARENVTWYVRNRMLNRFCYELFTYGQTDRTVRIK